MEPIQLTQLAQLDLNLLVAFDALATEGHVTRAAASVGLTQSAMSHALKRLRALFHDELFVRSGRGISPTPRARALRAPVRAALAAVQQAVRPAGSFDPARAERRFVIATNDYGAMLLAPPLLARVMREAPGVSLAVRQGSPETEREVDEGRVDLVIGGIPLTNPAFVRRPLFRETFVCLLREGHPAVGRNHALALERFVALPHVLISPMGNGWGFVDEALAKLGMKRRVVLGIAHFLAAPYVVAQTDAVLTVARRVARALGRTLPVREIEPPVKLPGFTMGMYWHPRDQDDPGHAWLRKLIAEIGRGLD